ncbi:hypothetical protein J3A64_004835 [Pseudarthrobacter sp. PvP004]|uniref:sigma-70 family RNA polymerase sigma factor n=1 Tax=Pseudarthrobacter sp. PvP004 TaxID=2817850 RepID=UPI001AEB5279|nr:sigma-70 family RNA polymerase sigma factor [Pseudarthrobacter sp. PvP004]MBP2269295.1 hypothetical protein [Pseudarthrobacter sp. PvP004]
MNMNQVPSGTPRRLTAQRAARRVGLSLEAFQAAADALNDTPEDLRLPGARKRASYDPERLNRWIQARLYPGPRIILVTAQWSEAGWLLYAPDFKVTSKAGRLVMAKRRIIKDLAVRAGTEPENIHLEIRCDPNHPALRAWSEATELKEQATRLLAEATRKRESAIELLTVEGMTKPEIGEALGLSYQRIHQLQTRARKPPSPQ